MTGAADGTIADGRSASLPRQSSVYSRTIVEEAAPFQTSRLGKNVQNNNNNKLRASKKTQHNNNVTQEWYNGDKLVQLATRRPSMLTQIKWCLIYYYSFLIICSLMLILLLLQLLIVCSAEKLQSSVRTCLNICSVLMQSRKRQVCAWVCNVCLQYVCTKQEYGLVEVHLVICI